MPDALIAAIGGHALMDARPAPSYEAQVESARRSLSGIADLAPSVRRIAITHGNGPQVGHILGRVEASRRSAYPIPLDACVAQSQGEIGSLLARELRNLLLARGCRKSVACVLTHVEVDPADPAFLAPDKPVGPVLSPWELRRCRRRGIAVMRDAGRGWRRSVPSPRPVRVIEIDVIERLVDSGVVVVAGGGGGIPVVRRNDGTLAGVEAVVDKDFTTTLIAEGIKATCVLNLGAASRLLVDGQREVDVLSADQAAGLLRSGAFPAGTMGPKIESALRFLERGGTTFVIARPEDAGAALAGRAGTRIERGVRHAPAVPGGLVRRAD